MQRKTQISVRELAHFIGLVVSSFPAIKPARIYYRDLELCKLDALSCNEGNYDSVFCLSEKANYALDWFILSCRLYNAIALPKPKSVITLTTDASQSGRGVACNEVSTSGRRGPQMNKLCILIAWILLLFCLVFKCVVKSRNCPVKVLFFCLFFFFFVIIAQLFPILTIWEVWFLVCMLCLNPFVTGVCHITVW